MTAISELSPSLTSKGGRPARSVYTVAAREYTSTVTAAAPSPVACSGGAQGTEKPSAGLTLPMRVAIPKSVRTGRWNGVMRMLDGLMSRWTMPARCRVSIAPPI